MCLCASHICIIIYVCVCVCVCVCVYMYETDAVEYYNKCMGSAAGDVRTFYEFCDMSL